MSEEHEDPTPGFIVSVMASGLVMRATQSMDVTLKYLQQLVQAADNGTIPDYDANALRQAGRHQVRCYRALMEAIDLHAQVPPEFQETYHNVKAHALESIDTMMNEFRDPEEEQHGADSD